MDDRLEEITPALSSPTGSVLSQDDFHRLLYDYFEDKGILTDLRAHLRTQMIKILKDTSLGTVITNKHKEISPKSQALNLLIAEYMLQKQYHYALSVFTTEVPLGQIFPTINDEIMEYRFPENDMWDILETLGIIKNSEQGKTISNNYTSTNEESLLNCILKTMSMNKESKANLNKLIKDRTEADLQKFVEILQIAEISPEITLQIIDHLKTLIKIEMHQIKEIKNDEVNKIKKDLEEECNKKVEKYKKKLVQAEKNFEKEKKKLDEELESAKSNLKNCAHSLQFKYKDLQSMEESLREKEKKLLMQEDILNNRENELANQRVEFIAASKVDKSQQTMESVNMENAVLKKNVLQLQVKVNDLCDQNRTYLSRIQDLAVRTSTLMRELEDSQIRVQELNGIQRSQGLFPPPPSLAAPSLTTLSSRTRYGIASYSGGGEEGSTVTPYSPRHFNNLSHHKDVKKRHAKKNEHKVNSSSDEISPTDAILNEAKQRLQVLEKESDQIDKHFQDYNMRSAQPSTNKIMKDFQINVATIRDNLSKLFNNPGTSASPTFQFVRGSNENLMYNKTEDRMKVQNLIADLPIKTASDYEFVINKIEPENTGGAESGQSSALILETSLSGVEMTSSGIKSDSEEDVVKNGKCKGN
ncbi:PREDICTED: oral-facial-digital syndrome 1 protein-like [Nicrophorus vespilloides]|uniref:Oral-facial-digital syndrome 1 protein-like n=1 Tax=Nicrophorus vespilloides TaxID=110193 RepID=A0ABM1NAA8_NICVS|nr:PREDICTED: oral-facial-digital syndrome 1 protein-like [Nicrophorus vespilloides]